MAHYKDAQKQRLYDSMLALAADKSSELYHEGKPRRGAGHRSAFWDGYRGDSKSAMVIPGTPSAVCYQAGKQFAKTNPGIEGTEFMHLKRMLA